MPFIPASRMNTASFSIFKCSMLQGDSLPLSDVIDDQRWQQIFDEHEIDFGNDPDAVYSPAIILWALISQVFFSGEQRTDAEVTCNYNNSQTNSSLAPLSAKIMVCCG